METTQIVLANAKGEVQLYSDGNRAGKMDVSVIKDKLLVYHTEIDDEYAGNGFAKLLFNQLVSYATENHLKIIPLCPYVHAQFQRDPEKYNDVWFEEEV